VAVGAAVQFFRQERVMRSRQTWSGVLFGGVVVALGLGCAPDQSTPSKQKGWAEQAAAESTRKVGVLLVNHGSRSARWRESLLAVEESVRPELKALDGVGRVTTAFMEYTEPSIATRLEEFDRDGFTDVVIVPLLLTVSSHSFDDIPTICGQQENIVALERLRAEGIRVYKSKARIHTTELLDFADILGMNVLRRARALSENPADEGVLLVGYGDADYEEAWSHLLSNRLGTVLREELGIPESSHCWCGHLVHYDPKVTQRAVEDLLSRRKRVLVVPVLVAVDEMFQEGVIQDGIDLVTGNSRVRYKPDAILPDAGVRQWVVDAARKAHEKIAGAQTQTAGSGAAETPSAGTMTKFEDTRTETEFAGRATP
jgi:hypothetical protein